MALRSFTTDIASINSRRLRWHCLFSSGAASTPDITRPRIRAAIGAAFTLCTCQTPIPYFSLPLARWRVRKFERLLWCVEWLCFDNDDCGSDVPSTRATSRPVTGAPPADQESVALCISIFLIGVDCGSLMAAEKLLPKRERNITDAEARSAETRM